VGRERQKGKGREERWRCEVQVRRGGMGWVEAGQTGIELDTGQLFS